MTTSSVGVFYTPTRLESFKVWMPVRWQLIADGVDIRTGECSLHWNGPSNGVWEMVSNITDTMMHLAEDEVIVNFKIDVKCVAS